MEARAYLRRWLGIDQDRNELGGEIARLESLLASNALQLAEVLARNAREPRPKLVTQTWSQAKRLMEGAANE